MPVPASRGNAISHTRDYIYIYIRVSPRLENAADAAAVVVSFTENDDRCPAARANNNPAAGYSSRFLISPPVFIIITLIYIRVALQFSFAAGDVGSLLTRGGRKLALLDIG